MYSYIRPTQTEMYLYYVQLNINSTLSFYAFYSNTTRSTSLQTNYTFQLNTWLSLQFLTMMSFIIWSFCLLVCVFCFPHVCFGSFICILILLCFGSFICLVSCLMFVFKHLQIIDTEWRMEDRPEVEASPEVWFVDITKIGVALKVIQMNTCGTMIISNQFWSHAN